MVLNLLQSPQGITDAISGSDWIAAHLAGFQFPLTEALAWVVSRLGI